MVKQFLMVDSKDLIFLELSAYSFSFFQTFRKHTT